MKKLTPIALAFALSYPIAFAAANPPSCSRTAGYRSVPVKMPVEHVLVIMQENHSFDNYLGRLNQPQFYGDSIDGVKDSYSNQDSQGNAVYAHHEPTLCPKDPGHRWNDMHRAWNGGKNDQWVVVNGPDSIGYYDQRDLTYYYALANQFAVADRYFASTMTQTFPNRFYLMTGTSFGHIKNIEPTSADQYDQPTIFDLLDKYNISWKYYANGAKGGYLPLFQPTYRKDKSKTASLADYEHDLASGQFPQVAFIESDYEHDEDEHPNENIQIGQAWVAKRIAPFMASPIWKNSVLFVTYDENGGFYDHVSPPQACAPDHIAPMLAADSLPGDFAQYGMRVPFIAISPYVKHHYISHAIFDHTSILKFIETKFNLPALTNRDANADAMLDLFDFEHPQNMSFDPATLPPAVLDSKRACGNSETPPQTNGPHGT